MTDELIQRATLLIEHKRYQDAEKHLRQVLAKQPDNVIALTLMAVALGELGRLDEALEIAQHALSQEPDHAYVLFLVGWVHLKKGNLKEASRFAQDAIGYDPQHAGYYALMAEIRLQEKNWEEALAYANRGLQVDPEDLDSLNTRATALLKLDRKEESYETIKEALHNDPHSSYTHSNLGWALLEKGDHKKALESFREALKLNPENNPAKAGLVEALKARYWFYRIFLRYTFWLSNKSAGYQWIFVLGLFVGMRIVTQLSKSVPWLMPVLEPVIYLYAAFALSTWIIEPLSNLLLRINIYGRYALTQDDIKASNFTAVGLLIALGGAASALLIDRSLVILALYGIGVMVLCGSMFKPRTEKNRNIAIAVAVILCAIGFLAIAMIFSGGDAGLLFSIFVFGILGYQFLLNYLVIK